jgi:hypothetical protein
MSTTTKPGWIGRARPHRKTNEPLMYHYYASGAQQSICKRADRPGDEKAIKTPPTGLACAKCEERSKR